MTENVSTISISYDHNMEYLIETFFFLDRFSDNFLSIDQRYEVGGGFIVGNWIGKLKEYDAKKINTRDLPTSQDKIKSLGWFDHYCENYRRFNRLPDETLLKQVSRDMTRLNGIAQNVNRSFSKRFGIVRPALLFGLFAEIEKPGKLTDSLYIADDMGVITLQPREHEMDADTRWRMEVRPTLEIRPEVKWRFKFKPYFKFPAPWEKWLVPYQDQETLDYRIDIYSSMEVRVDKDDEHQNKAVVLKVIYRYHFDNQPPTYLVPGAVAQNGRGKYLTAQKRHHLFRLSLGVTF